MVRTIAFTSLIVFIILGCGGSSTAEPVSAAKADPVRVTAWPAREPAAPLWPSSAKRVQVVVTTYGTDDLVWVISNGSHLVAVYHVPADQHDEVHARVNKQTTQAMAFVQLRMSRGGDCPKTKCATCCYVSTAPPGVIGRPPPDVAFVLSTAEAMNKAIPSEAL